MSDDAIEFTVTTQPPKSRRKGGPGRPRTNPFDKYMQTSYEQRFWELTDEDPEGHWYEVPDEMVEKRGAETVIGQIRNSAQYLRNNLEQYRNLHSEVRTDPDSGRIAFRGTPKVPKQRGSNQSETNEDVEYGESGEVMADEVYH